MTAERDAIFGWCVERIVGDRVDLVGPSYLYSHHDYPVASGRVLHAFYASEIHNAFGRIGPYTPRLENWPFRPELGRPA